MNKMITTIALLALVAMHSFSQENTSIGFRYGLDLHNVFWNGKPPSPGLGYGVGVTANIPKSPSLSLNPEINFYYRNVYNHEMSYGAKESLGEFSIGVPIMVRYKPSTEIPFYTALGVQVTFPISSELEQEFLEKKDIKTTKDIPGLGNDITITFNSEGQEQTIKYDDRAVAQFGAVLEFGYYITKKFAVDFRASFNFADFSTDAKDLKMKGTITDMKIPGAGGPPAVVGGSSAGGPPAGVDPNSYLAKYIPLSFKDDSEWLRPYLIQYGIGISYFF